MKLKFLKAKYSIDFKIPKDFEEKIMQNFSKAEIKNIAIFSAVQFRSHMDEVSKILSKLGFTTLTSKPFRTSIEGQLLGCDSYSDSLKLNLDGICGFVYIGDGYFHPNALLLAQENEKNIKPVILANIVQNITEVIDKSHIETYLKKKKANLISFYNNETIGVFVTTKWGQEYLETSLKLQEKYKEKKFYYFIGDNFSDFEMENFPWVKCWVNTACPRIGQDDITRHSKPVVNIKDIYK